MNNKAKKKMNLCYQQQRRRWMRNSSIAVSFLIVLLISSLAICMRDQNVKDKKPSQGHLTTLLSALKCCVKVIFQTFPGTQPSKPWNWKYISPKYIFVKWKWTECKFLNSLLNVYTISRDSPNQNVSTTIDQPNYQLKQALRESSREYEMALPAELKTLADRKRRGDGNEMTNSLVVQQTCTSDSWVNKENKTFYQGKCGALPTVSWPISADNEECVFDYELFMAVRRMTDVTKIETNLDFQDKNSPSGASNTTSSETETPAVDENLVYRPRVRKTTFEINSRLDLSNNILPEICVIIAYSSNNQTLVVIEVYGIDFENKTGNFIMKCALPNVAENILSTEFLDCSDANLIKVLRTAFENDNQTVQGNSSGETTDIGAKEFYEWTYSLVSSVLYFTFLSLQFGVFKSDSPRPSNFSRAERCCNLNRNFDLKRNFDVTKIKHPNAKRELYCHTGSMTNHQNNDRKRIDSLDGRGAQWRISNDTCTADVRVTNSHTNLTFFTKRNISENGTSSMSNDYGRTYDVVTNNESLPRELGLNTRGQGQCGTDSTSVRNQNGVDSAQIILKYFKPNHTTFTASFGKSKRNLVCAVTMVLIITYCFADIKKFGQLCSQSALLPQLTENIYYSDGSCGDYNGVPAYLDSRNSEIKLKGKHHLSKYFCDSPFPKFIFSYLPKQNVIADVFPLQRMTVSEMFNACNGNLCSSDVSPMNYELLRLETFCDFPLTCPVRPLNLAEAGFYYTKSGDQVCCFCCSVLYSGWRNVDNPRTVHGNISPDCPFIKGEECGNISIIRQVSQERHTSDVEAAVRQSSSTSQNETVATRVEPPFTETLYQRSACPNVHQERHQYSNGHDESLTREFAMQLQLQEIENLRQSQQQIRYESSNHVQRHAERPRPGRVPSESEYKALGIMTSRPRYPGYAVPTVRISSFQGWPSHLSQTARQMAAAGLFYSGYEDFVRCFHCGGGLRQWEMGDDPWVEHAKWFPRCSFVRQNKGEEFINLVHQTNNRQGDISQSTTSQMNLSGLTDVNTVSQVVCDMGYSAVSVNEIIQELQEENQTVTAERILDRIFLKEDGVGPSTSVPTTGSPSNGIEERTIANKPLTDEENKNTATGKSQQDVYKALGIPRLCRVCQEQNSNVALLPCGHICCCRDCAPAMRKCPFCKGIVKGTVRIHLA